MPEIIVNLLRGVNRHRDAITHLDGEAAELKNLYPVKPGILSLRPGMKEVQPLTSGWPCVRALHLSSLLSDALLCVTGATTQRGDTLGAGDLVRVVRAKQGEYGLYTTDDVVLGTVQTGGGNATPSNLGGCHFLDLGTRVLFVGSGVDPMVIEEPFAAAAAITWSGGPGGFRPHIACLQNRRVVYGWGNKLVWSDIDQPLTLGQAYAVSPDDVSPITAIAVVSESNLAQSTAQRLLVCTEKATYIVSGAPNESTEPNPKFPDLVKFNNNDGCASFASLVRTQHGVFWCGTKNVWLYTGQAPIPVGENIKGELAYVPQAMRWKIHAAYNEALECYQLALPAEGQSVTEATPLNNHWMLELRAPLEPWRWFGPQVYIPALVQDTTYGGGEVKGTTVLTTDHNGRVVSALPVKNIPLEGDNDIVVRTHLVAFDGELAVDSAHEVLVAEYPDRLPATAYALGDFIVFGAYLFVCTVAGTTSSSAARAVFSYVLGDDPLGDASVMTVNDGTASWTCIGYQRSYSDGVAAYLQPTMRPRYITPSYFDQIAVNWRILCRQYVGSGIVLDKVIDASTLTYSSQTGATAYYHYLPYYMGTSAPGVQKVLPRTTMQRQYQDASLGTQYDQYQERMWNHLTMVNTERKPTKHIQPRYSANASIIIDDTNDVITLCFVGLGGVWNRETRTLAVNIPHGIYTFNNLGVVIFGQGLSYLQDYLEGLYGVYPNLSVSINWSVYYPVMEYTVTLVAGAGQPSSVLVRFFFTGSEFDGEAIGWTDDALQSQRRLASIFGAEETTTAGASGASDGNPETVRNANYYWEVLPAKIEIGDLRLMFEEYERVGTW